jgi:glycosyltransferase involved in cell wall biosynthesis
MAEEAGAKVRTIDVSGRPGPANWRNRAAKIPKMLLGVASLAALLARRRVDAVYLGVASGQGQLFDIVVASLTRLFGPRLFMHYQSYAFLDRRRLLSAALIQVAGPSTRHIVLCEAMKERLTELYGQALQVAVVSNITNTEPPVHGARSRTRLRTIGLLSYLSRSKGVLEFLDVAERLRSTHPDALALLAGPIEEPSLAQAIEARLHKASWITYLGPLYGEDKARFYASIDAFVFPTRYEHEADPRVINEALAHGVAVIARERGCIASVVAEGGGAIIRGDTDFVDEAARLLTEWYEQPAVFSSVSSAALTNAKRLNTDHGIRLKALVRELVSAPSPDSTPN